MKRHLQEYVSSVLRHAQETDRVRGGAQTYALAEDDISRLRTSEGKENAMASLPLDEFQEFESRALPSYASSDVIETILRTGALVCVVLLLSGLGLAQQVVTARATIPFTFWAQDHEFQAGDYVFDNEVPGTTTIQREGSTSGIGVSVILYAVPQGKENPRVIFVRRDGKYFLVELWGVQDRHVVTAEFQHRGEESEQQRQVPVTIVEAHVR
jgi:hypothetical protein